MSGGPAKAPPPRPCRPESRTICRQIPLRMLDALLSTMHVLLSPMRSTSTPGWPADMSYMGPFYPIRNEPPMHHIVRVGWDTPKHPDEEHVDFWTLAHGLPARVVSVRWTRRAIIEAANEARHARCTGHPVQPRQRTNTSAPRLTAPQFVGIGTRRT